MLKQSVEQLLRSRWAVELPFWAEVLVALVNVLLILTLAWILQRVVGRVVRLLKARLAASAEGLEGQKRVETLGRVFGYVASVAIGILTLLLVLSEIGISIAPLLATAGVAGVAIGFGAQSLVKDYFSGFVMLMENQIRQGDVVEIAGKTGLVEEVTLRHVRLRDYEGAVHFVPNGAIDTVTNKSRGFAFAVMDIGVAYRESLDRVYRVIEAVAGGMRADAAFALKIIEDIEIAGVEQWADSAVVIKVRLKVSPLEQWGVRREFMRRLKLAFDSEGIEIPFPQRVVHTLSSSSDRPVVGKEFPGAVSDGA